MNSKFFDPANYPALLQFLSRFGLNPQEIDQVIQETLQLTQQIQREQANSAEAITKKATEEAKKLNDEHEKLAKERIKKEKEAEIANIKTF